MADERIRVAFRDDPSRVAILRALRDGLVDRGGLEVETSFLPISGLIEATGRDDFDLVESSTLFLATAGQRGLDVRLAAAGLRDRGSVMLFVREDSDVHELADLRGRSIARQPGGASSTLMLRYVLEVLYGIPTANGSEIRWEEIPDARMTAALESSEVDAAMQNSFQGWLALRHPRLRLLHQATTEFVEHLGNRPLNTGLIGRSDYLADNADTVRRLNDLLARSVAYADQHRRETFESVGAETGVPPDYLSWWWDMFDILWRPVEPEDAEGIRVLWDAALALGDITGPLPPIHDVLHIGTSGNRNPEKE